MINLNKKVLRACLAVSFFVIMIFFLNPGRADAAFSRLAGPDRYQTAVAISQKGWQEADYVILVKADEFADALCAGPLAAKYNAPILFTEGYNVNYYTLEEIKRLKADNAIIVGGYESISGYVEQSLYSAGIDNIERIYGSNRYETSVEIAKRLGSKEVAIATADSYADALSISAVAAAKGYSILLTPPGSLPEVVQKHLDNYKIEKTYLIGGTEVIGKAIEKQVPSPVRLAGNDRFDTNRLILEKFAADLDFNKIYAATGEGRNGYADSLAGVVLAAKTSSPIVLNGKTLAKATKNYVQSKMTVASYIVALGGEEAVPYAVVNDYTQSLGKVRKSVFNQKGSYGPASGTTTVAGSLAVEASNITVQNTVIEGDLLLGEGIGGGTVELVNVTVKGRTTIRGGGTDSIVGNNFTSKSAVIDVPYQNKVSFRLKGKSKVDQLTIETNALIDDSENTSEGVKDISILRGADVTLKGSYNTVNTASNGLTLRMEDAKVKTLNALSRQSVSGSGTISTANVSSNGVVLYFSPSVTKVAEGYEAYVAGQIVGEGTTKGGSSSSTSGAATPISNLTAAAGNGQVTLTFSAPTGASTVTLQQSTDSSNWTNSSVSLTASSTSATVSGLTNGQVYYFRLVVSGGSKAGNSNTASAMPVGQPISDLAATAGDRQATFTFSQPVNASSVILEQSTDGGINWSISTVLNALNASSTTATVTGLTNGQSYRFRLVVSGGSRAGTSNVITVNVLGPLTDLSGTSGDRQVSLTFSAPSGATSVKLRQSTNGTDWTDSTVTPALNAGSTSTTATGLTNGQVYYFKLVVTGGPRAGDSNVVNVTPH